MNLTINARHLDLTEALENYVKQKLERVWSHFPIISATLRLASDPDKSVASADVAIKGKTLHIEESSPDMYAAIDRLVDALHEALRKVKERASEHRGRRGRNAKRGLLADAPTKEERVAEGFALNAAAPLDEAGKGAQGA